MNDGPEGMVVYERDSDRRGVVTSVNYSNNFLTVQWDDGARGLHLVNNLRSEKVYLEQQQEQRMKQMALKPEQAVLGAVVYAAGKEAPLRKGKIAGPIDNSHGNNLVIVEWTEGWGVGQLNKMQLNALLSEADGLAETTRLVAEKEKLEREYEQVRTECGSKLAKAAQLIREAATLADSKGADLQEMYDETRDLERAMEAAGWRTSSWHC